MYINIFKNRLDKHRRMYDVVCNYVISLALEIDVSSIAIMYEQVVVLMDSFGRTCNLRLCPLHR